MQPAQSQLLVWSYATSTITVASVVLCNIQFACQPCDWLMVLWADEGEKKHTSGFEL